MAPFDRSHTSSTVTIAISCIVSEIKRDRPIRKKRQLFIPPSFNLHDHLEILKILTKILTQTESLSN